uniref:Uncharacterized protein n=1 Tax=Anguilla anguilla TaxID=7936 RepID=A0A0E9T422_ANGAN
MSPCSFKSHSKAFTSAIHLLCTATSP